ncbi:hypothetical protein KGQ20_39490 [Catenulispora sp. NF23]|uniref:hypothetical protein n=1 Tax=Catenulispora pinistramenti TaxID=2705254 RepID=UPI001BAD381F|nr:hypothetical protein [Catenulispora pinistramenti]MBS2538848.1 hypothetical protein [Catenulispora pinistramenti]
MSDTFAIQYVLNGLHADIARRNTLIREHVASAARLQADNATDARHAEVAQALIDQINADALAAAWAPTNEIDAAALVTDCTALIASPARAGKTSAWAQRLAALHDATADIAAIDGAEAAGFVHDHAADDCPACLLTGTGDLATLDGIGIGTGTGEVAR